jgi:hypothetical protein
MRGALAPVLALALATAAMATAGCARDVGGEGPLLRALGDDVDLIVVATPPRVAGTWVERAATMLVPSVPPCVLDRARTADAIAVTWRHDDPDGGATAGTDPDAGAWTFVLAGGRATSPGCEELSRGGGLAWLGPDPRTGKRRFFAAAERKRRWRALGDAPIRVVGDVEVQAGIVVHAAGSLDPRDGIDARALLRFDERAAADGFDQLRKRYSERLDRERLGGAWPAFDASVTRDPRDPGGTTLRGELRIPGRSGEEAMIFATSAIVAGELDAPGAPCPWIADAWKMMVTCTGNGRFTISSSLRDLVVDEPEMLGRDARVVPAMKNGARAGFKLYAIRPASLAAALGFQNGDRIHTVGGRPTPGVPEAEAAIEHLRSVDQFTVEVERRGSDVTLRYDIR